MNFTFVTKTNPLPLLFEIKKQPELWNKNPCRLSKKGPHHETQDMFLRYKDEKENIESNDWSNFSNEHVPVWNKTIDFLPSARTLVFDLAGYLRSEMIGGVFIYKVEPGKQIYTHVDKGWHAEYFDKFNVCLQSNPQAAFVYENERMVQSQGDIHWFRNDVPHSVINEGECDHIVMTVCLRFDKGYRSEWSPEGWSLDQSLGR